MNKENQTKNKKELGSISFTVYKDGTIKSDGSMAIDIASWALGALINDIINSNKDKSYAKRNNEMCKCIKYFAQGIGTDLLRAGWTSIEEAAPIPYEAIDYLNVECLFTVKNQVHFGIYNRERHDFYEYKTKQHYPAEKTQYWISTPSIPLSD